ncbi:MAG: DUF177 domain-containing protein [Solirubrobacteraceae bacterium]|nr:DUF177 domain-containing protein [Solirubrobacteraceae bacterium]
MEAVPGRFELGALHLAAGEGTRAEVTVSVEPVRIGTEDYTIGDVPVVLDIARMIGGGYSLRLRAEAAVNGTCLRCLDTISLDRELDIREIDRPTTDEDELDDNETDDLASPYVDGDILALADWLRDTLVLELPATMAPPTDDDGRCELCRRTLVDLGAPEPSTEVAPDPRWAKLRELNISDEPSPN